jgi:HPt (histidine-containing phosphotransfer) domain-containing protein
MQTTTPTDTASNPTQLPAWDETAALAAVGGDRDLALELIKTLIAGLPAELAGLKDCSQNKDTAELREAAHRMRGATRYCGVLALDAALGNLERAAKASDVGSIAVHLAQVEAEVARLTAAFP